MADIALWKDTRIIPAQYGGDYSVEDGNGATLFNGRTYDGNSAVFLNDLAKNYVGQALPLQVVQGGTAEPYDHAVTLTAQPAGITNRYFLDWSYKDGRTANSPKVNPIDAQIDSRQVLILTRSNIDATSVTLYGVRNGSTYAIKTFSGLTRGEGYNIVYPMSALSGYTSLYLSDNPSQKYFVVDTCARYILYYVNAFGGWDSYILRGAVQETQGYTPREYLRSFNNESTRERNLVRYGVDVARGWTIKTEWLHDAEQARMWHLLGSPLVYIVDLMEGFAPVPVVIKNTQWTAQTFKVDGMFRAEISIEQATTTYR